MNVLQLREGREQCESLSFRKRFPILSIIRLCVCVSANEAEGPGEDVGWEYKCVCVCVNVNREFTKPSTPKNRKFKKKMISPVLLFESLW